MPVFSMINDGKTLHRHANDPFNIAVKGGRQLNNDQRGVPSQTLSVRKAG